MEGFALKSKSPQPRVALGAGQFVGELEGKIAEAARNKTMIEYCEWALASLRKAVSFERALWVLGTSEGDFEVVASQGIDADKALRGYAGLNPIDPVFAHFKSSPTQFCVSTLANSRMTRRLCGFGQRSCLFQ